GGGLGRRARARGPARRGRHLRRRRVPPLRAGPGRRRVSELVFVGTGDAFGAGGRRQSALLLRAQGGSGLLDCGATASRRLSQLGIARDELDAILISHFHGDHFGGIPFLLLGALYEDRRRRPLWIAGPRGIEARVRALATAMGYSLDEREWSFPIRFEELVP